MLALLRIGVGLLTPARRGRNRACAWNYRRPAAGAEARVPSDWRSGLVPIGEPSSGGADIPCSGV